MTVGELIEKLKSYDENLEVNICANGGAFDLDDAVIMIETWTAEDGKRFDALDIKFD